MLLQEGASATRFVPLTEYGIPKTPLCRALERKDPKNKKQTEELIVLLQKFNASLNAPCILSENCLLPIHIAVRANSHHAVTYLLDHTFGPNQKVRIIDLRQDPFRPLHFATTVAMARLLIERGADPKKMPYLGCHIVRLQGKKSVELARFLLQNGAQLTPEAKDIPLEKRQWPLNDNTKGELQYALYRSKPYYTCNMPINVDMVRFLIQQDKINVNRLDYSHGAPLHLAVEQACFQAVKLLCDRDDININLKDRQFKTPLWHIIRRIILKSEAISDNEKKVIKLLKQKRASIDADIKLAINGILSVFDQKTVPVSEDKKKELKELLGLKNLKCNKIHAKEHQSCSKNHFIGNDLAKKET